MKIKNKSFYCAINFNKVTIAKNLLTILYSMKHYNIIIVLLRLNAQGVLLKFSTFRGGVYSKGGGGGRLIEGDVYKSLAIFFSHKIKKPYKILKSLQYI